MVKKMFLAFAMLAVTACGNFDNGFSSDQKPGTAGTAGMAPAGTGGSAMTVTVVVDAAASADASTDQPPAQNGTGGQAVVQLPPGATCVEGSSEKCPGCPDGVVQTCHNNTYTACPVCPITATGTGGSASTGTNTGSTASATSTGGCSTTVVSTGGRVTASTGGTSTSMASTGGTATVVQTGGRMASTGGTSVSTGGTSTGSGSASTGGSSTMTCSVQGLTASCTCSNSSAGAMVCVRDNANQLSWSACACQTIGTGGSSSTTSTGGTTSTSSSGGSIATSTGGTGTASVDHYRVVLQKKAAMDPSKFLMSVEYDLGASKVSPVVTCGTLDVHFASCEFDVVHGAVPEAWVRLDGQDNWSPGMDTVNGTKVCASHATWLVYKNGGQGSIPFSCKLNAAANGFRYRFESAGPPDSDLDGNPDNAGQGNADCDITNPTIGQNQAEQCGGMNADCNDSTPSPSCSGANVQTVHFELPVSFVSGDTLTIMDPFQTFGCGSASVVNRETGATVAGTFCDGTFDVSVQTELYIRAGGQYPTGLLNTSDTTCTRFFNVYVYVGSAWYARFDGASSLNGFLSRMTANFVSSMQGCHLQLPTF